MLDQLWVNHAAGLAIATDGIALLVLVLLLSAAVYTDIRHHRIPNRLTFSVALIGLLLQLWAFGFSGLLIALAGMVAGFLILLPLYASGGTAAGDVKLMMAVGTLLGPLVTLAAGLFTMVAGGVLGLVILYARRFGSEHLLRYTAVTLSRYTGQSPAVVSKPGTAQRFPYAAAIAAGTLAAAYLFNVFNVLSGIQGF